VSDILGLKAMNGVLRAPLDGRQAKPRQAGLTMVLDKGLGARETDDLLAIAADYVDIIKISFGTAALYPLEVLRAKIRAIRSHGITVCPGGTLLEIAILENRLSPFLARTASLGFNALEVSDGTIHMGPAQRGAIITAVLDAGFEVISEVGKKDQTQRLSPAETASRVSFDLDYGANLVVLEARESGRGVGIFSEDGSVKEGELETIIAGLDRPEAVLWEAPLKNQQAYLILRLGVNVNLGNIPPSEVYALEALRLGLRSDTLRVQVPSESPFSLDGGDQV
jgi:phosphosulfolactate synthase